MSDSEQSTKPQVSPTTTPSRHVLWRQATNHCRASQTILCTRMYIQQASPGIPRHVPPSQSPLGGLPIHAGRCKHPSRHLPTQAQKRSMVPSSPAPGVQCKNQQLPNSSTSTCWPQLDQVVAAEDRTALSTRPLHWIYFHEQMRR